MKKLIQKLFLVLLTWIICFLSIPNINNVKAYAFDCSLTVSGPGIKEWVDSSTNTFYYSSNNVKKDIIFTFKINNPDWWKGSSYDYQNAQYKFIIDSSVWHMDTKNSTTQSPDLTKFEYTKDNGIKLDDGDYSIRLIANDENHLICEGKYHIVPKLYCDLTIIPIQPAQDINSSWIVAVRNFTIQSSFIRPNNLFLRVEPGSKYICYDGKLCPAGTIAGDMADNGKFDITIQPRQFDARDQDYNLWIDGWKSVYFSDTYVPICGPASFHVYPLDDAICQQSPCLKGIPRSPDINCELDQCQTCSWCRLNPTPTLTPFPTPTNADFCNADPCTRGIGPEREHDCSIQKCKDACNFCNPPTPILSNTPIPPLPDLVKLCDQIDGQYKDACHKCVDPGGMWTAIGCLPTAGLESFLKDYLFTFGIGIAGGIAFLYFLYGSFLFLTSAGNAETVGQAKEIIISALSGLIFILLSIFFLKIIGADILKIPGFT